MSEILSHEQQKQRALLEQLLQPQPTVVAIEGGPCGGKSTLLQAIQQQAAATGRSVVAIPEVVDVYHKELRKAGTSIPELAQHDRSTFLRVQTSILKDIITAITEKQATHEGTNTVIVIDRADIGAYITKDEYKAILSTLGEDVPPIYKYVDSVQYLPSVAQESPEKYESLKSTNTGRYEDGAQARATCQANLRSVAAHPELHVAWGGEFTEKMRRVARSILQPELEGEIKQAVPSVYAADIITKADVLYQHEITQSYHVLDGQEFRLRVHLNTPLPQFYFTAKHGDGVVRTEIQRRITAEEYALLRQLPQIGNELRKTRVMFLDAAVESDGRRRLWCVDKYSQPNLSEWHFETDVETATEAEELSMLYEGVRKHVSLSARVFVHRV